MTSDTMAEWLWRRFSRDNRPWWDLVNDEKLYWEHEAAAVRRAVERGGFKNDQ